MVQTESDLPKGMEPTRAPVRSEKPAPLHLGCGNYAGAIRQALDLLPVRIRYDRFLVLEQEGRSPQVRITLTILGEKEGYVEWKSREDEPSPEGL